MQSASSEWKEGGGDGGRRNPRGCLFFSLSLPNVFMLPTFARLFPFLRQPPPLLWRRENSWLSSAASAARRGTVSGGQRRHDTAMVGVSGRRPRCTVCHGGSGGHGRPNVTNCQFAACLSFLLFTSLPFTSIFHPKWQSGHSSGIHVRLLWRDSCGMRQCGE